MASAEREFACRTEDDVVAYIKELRENALRVFVDTNIIISAILFHLYTGSVF